MLYEPIKTNRLFAPGLKYSDVDWDSFSAVLNAFQQRMEDWYFSPIRLLRNQPGQPGGFTAMSTCCLLIDCLCQFDAGKVMSNKTEFINYVKKRLPNYKRSITPSIKFPKTDPQHCIYETDSTGAIRTREIKTIAEAIYYIFRCGILHSAHAPLCGVITGFPSRRFSIRTTSLAKYNSIGANGSPCPVVLIDPWKLFDEIDTEFKRYIERLKMATVTQTVRLKFNIKFIDCFGINIAGVK